MKSKIKFSLIICGYNEEKNLDRCIQSCLNQKYPKKSYEIIYVDNNSKDNSLKIAKNYPIKILTEKRQGLSESRNKGIRRSSGEILVFLDADLKLDPNYLRNHEKTFNNPEVGAGGGKVLPIKKTWISNYLGVSLFEGYPRYKEYRLIRTYPGCNLTIRKNVLEKIGGFKEKLRSSKGVTRFAEDKEICERIRKNKYKILYNPLAVVYHKNTADLTSLVKIWIKGSKSRADMIKNGKKDPFSNLLRFNLPLFTLLLFLVLLLTNPEISLMLIITYLVLAMSLSIKTFVETGLFFQSFFVKPILDGVSIIIINIAIIYYRVHKDGK